MYSRRRFAGLVTSVAARPVARAHPDSKIKGVIVGAQSYSFRDRSLDETIRAVADIGLSYVELWSRHLEPKHASDQDLRRWRVAPDTISIAKQVRRKFNQAGIRVYALNYTFRKEHSDEEILQGMEMAKALGTDYITASSTVDQAARLNHLAGRKGVLVAVHNHANVKDPNEYATPETFAKTMQNRPNLRINLDIGHFVAANYDPVEYIRNHHDRILCLHIKDRKRLQGASVPFGRGDTPIGDVLKLLRNNRWQIPAMIEYEYDGGDAVEEVRKSYEYMRRTLLQ